jgi:galactokinase
VAGYRAGILDLVEESSVVGLQVLIEGNIPWAAGISSSSAFSVCSAMVSHFSNKAKNIEKEEFIERCIRYEREVGTASGGMDQSISYLGKKHSCLYIQFNPIRTEKVDVPLENYTLIIMNSLVESPKM